MLRNKTTQSVLTIHYRHSPRRPKSDEGGGFKSGCDAKLPVLVPTLTTSRSAKSSQLHVFSKFWNSARSIGTDGCVAGGSVRVATGRGGA